MNYWVYILFSKKLSRHYTGVTSNLNRRMDFHITAPTTKFTGKTDDWEVFLHFQCDNKRQALAIERHVKQMKSKVYIQNLKKFPELITKLRAKYS